VATLADTNILLRSLNPGDPHYGVVKNALARLRLRDEALCIAPQNLIEFWAVATRRVKENGLGLTSAEAENEIVGIRRFFFLLPYTPEVLETRQRLVVQHGVSGKQTHDAHLVAIMTVHGVQRTLTLNEADFKTVLPG
jgi:predicted nucleic acid-binding protein